MDRMIILISLLVVIITGSINRRIGGILGVMFTAGLTWWGLNVIKSGGELYILKYNISRETFLVIMAFFFVYNLLLAIIGKKKREE